MFKIRSEQKASFREDAVRDFEDRVVAHVRRCFPDRWTTMGDSMLRAVIRDGIGRAATHGIISERDVCKFIDLMLIFGTTFDRERAWAREILDAAAPGDPRTKLGRLLQHAEEDA